MPKETTVRLESYFLAFIEEMVASGRYSSPSQVVQAGLRLLEQRESHADALATALQEGEDSGWVEDFDFDEFLARKNAEFVGRGGGAIRPTSTLKTCARACGAWPSILLAGVR